MGLIPTTLPTIGDDRGTEETDILSALTTLFGLVNGSIDNSNIAASAGILASKLETNAQPVTTLAAYKTVFSTPSTSFDSGASTSLCFWASSGLASSGSAAGAAHGLIVPSSSPWTVSGRTAKLRLVAGVAGNTVASGIASLTFTLRPATFAGSAGQITVTAGASIGQVTLAPATSSFVSGVSADLSIPAAGLYLPCVQANTAAAANSELLVSARVELHHV